MTKLRGTSDESATTASCLVFDSCPGVLDFWDGLRGFTIGITPTALRLLAYIPISLFLLWMILSQKLSSKPPLIAQLRSTVADSSPFPWMTKDTPRLFIYSDSDQVVPAHAVETAVELAKEADLNVSTEKFHGSAHVSHARKDSGKYWSAIEKAWAEALEAARQRKA